MDEEKPIRAISELPRRIKGRHSSSFKTIALDTNYYAIKIAGFIEEIYIYKVVFKPAIPHDNSKLRMSLLESLLGQIKDFIPSPVFSGQNIYSLKPPAQK